MGCVRSGGKRQPTERSGCDGVGVRADKTEGRRSLWAATRVPGLDGWGSSGGSRLQPQGHQCSKGNRTQARNQEVAQVSQLIPE